MRIKIQEVKYSGIFSFRKRNLVTVNKVKNFYQILEMILSITKNQQNTEENATEDCDLFISDKR